MRCRNSLWHTGQWLLETRYAPILPALDLLLIMDGAPVGEQRAPGRACQKEEEEEEEV